METAMGASAPTLDDYDRVRKAFIWDGARAELDGLPGGRGLNIAHEAVDRHAAGPRGDRIALRWPGKRGEVHDYSYCELRELTDRFANVVAGLGLQRGERVFALAGRLPELYVAALGTLKYGAVFCPMFSAFGPEPIRARMAIGRARVLVTTEALYRRKVAALRDQLPDLAHVILIGEGGAPTAVPGTLDFHARLQAAADRFVIPPTAPEDMALLHFTSGTAGKPKGAVHVHEAVVGGLRSSELSDPTITVTSLGEQGVESVLGIVYPPQVAIVGFGRVAERPWVVDGAVVPRPLVTASLSADHRVSDGHRGGLFLGAVERPLQAPERL
jgi:acyl-CoA synthetase (AMP-forming)/AMP-acid ligase II